MKAAAMLSLLPSSRQHSNKTPWDKGRHICCPVISLISDGGEETVFFVVFAQDRDEYFDVTKALLSSLLVPLLSFQPRSENPANPNHL